MGCSACYFAEMSAFAWSITHKITHRKCQREKQQQGGCLPLQPCPHAPLQPPQPSSPLRRTPIPIQHAAHAHGQPEARGSPSAARFPDAQGKTPVRQQTRFNAPCLTVSKVVFVAAESEWRRAAQNEAIIPVHAARAAVCFHYSGQSALSSVSSHSLTASTVSSFATAAHFTSRKSKHACTC